MLAQLTMQVAPVATLAFVVGNAVTAEHDYITVNGQIVTFNGEGIWVDPVTLDYITVSGVVVTVDGEGIWVDA